MLLHQNKTTRNDRVAFLIESACHVALKGASKLVLFFPYSAMSVRRVAVRLGVGAVRPTFPPIRITINASPAGDWCQARRSPV
jgi:hypothetical protein